MIGISTLRSEDGMEERGQPRQFSVAVAVEAVRFAASFADAALSRRE
jgi:hypothetical protein